MVDTHSFPPWMKFEQNQAWKMSDHIETCFVNSGLVSDVLAYLEIVPIIIMNLPHSNVIKNDIIENFSWY